MTNPSTPAVGEPPAAGMLWVPGGTVLMGSDRYYPEEAPAREVSVDGLWVSRTTVTNAKWAAFVDATSYVSVAERPLDAADFPGAPVENLAPGSMVFVRTPGPVDLRHLSQWWEWMPGASWRTPEGSGSNLVGREDHPVVHVAHEDAAAYARWAGLSLPTEAQWEHAARGGLQGQTYTWGDEPELPGQGLANHWNGDFPWRADDGYGTTRPVGSFPANGYGLADMAGNVWEWTQDWYVENRWADTSPCCVPRDPRGGTPEDSYDSAQPQFRVPRKVIKGGSFLCADSYCMRYRPAARRPQMIDTGMSHIGFRCILPDPSAGLPTA
jgi:formylglycine-generating enzyme required for sulfatase activity